MKSILERVSIKEILELSDAPTIEEVKRNYKRLALKYHPDRNKSPEANEYMKRINNSYTIIMQRINQGNPQREYRYQQPVQRRTIIVTVNIYGNQNTWTYTTGDPFNS